MRIPSLLAAALLTCLVPALPVGAESAADDKKKEEPITVPSFSIESLVPEKKDLLDGWLVLEDAPPAGHPTEAALEAVATSVGLDEDTYYAEVRVVQTPAGAKAGVALIDIDTDPAKAVAAFKTKATEAGWAFHELAVPSRLLIVGGAPEVRDPVANEMIAHVVYEFAALARARLNVRHQWDKEVNKDARRQSKGFVMAARALVPEAGVAYAIEAFYDLHKHFKHKGEAAGAKKKLEKEKDPEKKKKLIDKQTKAKKEARAASVAFISKASKALATDAKLPPRGTLEVSLAGQAGGVLLERKDDSVVRDAVRFLEIAVAGQHREFVEGYGNRYNLACAYARLGQKDKAFDLLRKSLEMGTLLPFKAYGSRFHHMEKKDPDMKSLRHDERWDPLIKEFRNDKVAKWEKWEKARKEREKKEKERRKKDQTG